ncbi:GNAT family N-acetyltransferase [Sphingomonas sp. 3-13AW]|jgi:GNAT superfamily N-acetyltransferase|uniref:GNAT family N-acetyltransferase n=1 Tax=Sphingomonas sp. 3-13AW TaxID=3050450 RepID=UPI003BB6C80E
MIEIRDAISKDAGLIFGFVRDLARHEAAEAKLAVTPAVLETALSAEPPEIEAAIAERDGQAVGIALYFFNRSTWSGWRGLYLEDLYVAPEARGSGAGRALLAHLARVARERGCSRMEWAVTDGNAAASGFYRSLGAQPLDWRIYRIAGDALAALAGE